VHALFFLLTKKKGPQISRGLQFGPGMTEAGFWGTYREIIVKMLVWLCEVSAERLSHLRRVHYVSDYWSRRWQGYYYSAEKPFAEIQVIMFSQRGIEFYAAIFV
jgi:hypothetical protein